MIKFPFSETNEKILKIKVNVLHWYDDIIKHGEHKSNESRHGNNNREKKIKFV